MSNKYANSIILSRRDDLRVRMLLKQTRQPWIYLFKCLCTYIFSSIIDSFKKSYPTFSDNCKYFICILFYVHQYEAFNMLFIICKFPLNYNFFVSYDSLWKHYFFIFCYLKNYMTHIFQSKYLEKKIRCLFHHDFFEL